MLLSDSTVLGPISSSWCKSAIGVLHCLARGTKLRWDISLTTSMISQFNATPTRGTEAALRYLAGYLNAIVSPQICCVMRPKKRQLNKYCN